MCWPVPLPHLTHRTITTANVADALEMFEEVARHNLEKLPEADRALERNYLLGSAAASGLAERAFSFEIEQGGEVRASEDVVQVPSGCGDIPPGAGFAQIGADRAVRSAELLVDHRALRQLGPARAARRAEDDLRHGLGPGGADERLGHVVARRLDEPAAEIGEQLLVLLEPDLGPAATTGDFGAVVRCAAPLGAALRGADAGGAATVAGAGGYG